MSCHAEFLRVALANDARLSRAVLTGSIEAVGEHCHDDRQRALVELVRRVTTAPWTLSHGDRLRWTAAGLHDDDLLHAIVLSAYFGHLNRIADAVGVPLDYTVEIPAPAPDPAQPPLPAAPAPITGRRAIELELRPATDGALASWRSYIAQKTGPLAPGARAQIADWVATWLGDGSAPRAADAGPFDAELHALVERVTLAPWRLGDAAFQPLRARGFDDATLFDACATATSAGMFSRIAVALMALGR